jgi:hypothetical protein
MLTKFNEYLFEYRVRKDEKIDILRDDKYIVVAPLSEEASCKYGAFTHWCTSNPDSGAWDLGIGQDYINLKNNNKIVYIIQRNYKLTSKNEEQSEEYYHLFKKFENGDFDERDDEKKLQERFDEINNDIDSLNFSKIAVEYNFKHQWWSLWTANNICISDHPWNYGLTDLPIDEYVIRKIVEFCEI